MAKGGESGERTMKPDIHPSTPLAIASGAVVLAGLDVFTGLLAVRDDEAYLVMSVSLGLRLFAGLCLVTALVAALLAPRRRSLQVAGVFGVGLLAIAVGLVGYLVAKDASAFVP